jgi:hypothetical protein
MNREIELFDAFERVDHQDCPNPQRTNCPGRSVLWEMAAEPEALLSASTLAHIRTVCPCFNELKELRRRRPESPFLAPDPLA